MYDDELQRVGSPDGDGEDAGVETPVSPLPTLAQRLAALRPPVVTPEGGAPRMTQVSPQEAPCGDGDRLETALLALSRVQATAEAQGVQLRALAKRSSALEEKNCALEEKNSALEAVVVQLAKQVGEMEELVSMCVDAVEARPAHRHEPAGLARTRDARMDEADVVLQDIQRQQ